MILRHIREQAKPRAGLLREVVPHRERIVAMAADAQVRVVRENRARPHGVPATANHFSERLADRLPLRVVEPQHRELQPRPRLSPEFLQLFSILLG